nr:hypothetical protein [Oenococcus oeni]
MTETLLKKKLNLNDQFLLNLKNYQEIFWKNPNYGDELPDLDVNRETIFQANRRLERFAPYLGRFFQTLSEVKALLNPQFKEWIQSKICFQLKVLFLLRETI